MRIAFLGPSAPFRGGIAQFAENLAGKFISRGDEVMMFTFVSQYPDMLFPGSKQTAGEECSLPTLRVLTPYNPATFGKTQKAIADWKPDVLLISYWLPVMAPAFAYIAGRLPGIKKYFLIHNLDFHEKWFLADSFTCLAFRSGDGFITLSEVSAKALSRLVSNAQYRKNIRLWHPAYELNVTTASKPAPSPVRRVMLFFGFIKHYKGLDILLDAMPLVIRQKPEIRLIIAGDVYGSKELYLDKIRQNGISDSVECHFNYINDEELAAYFAHSDVCVLPYRSATQSGVVQMAFAHQTPVIATRVGGIEETVKDGINGLLCQPDNPWALADTILEFYNHNEIPKYKAAIIDHNRKHSWDCFVDILKESLCPDCC